MVKKGDVIARIEQPELVAKINSLQSTLQENGDSPRAASNQSKETESLVKELQDELLYKSQIVSNIDGRILEMNIDKGSIVQPGTPLVTMEEYGGAVRMQAVIYVPAEQGKKILPGMEVQIFPSTVNKEEYGFMLGWVSFVSEYPSTTQSMMQTLGSEKLV